MSGESDPRGATAGHVRVSTAARLAGMTVRQVYERIDRGEIAAAKDDEGMVVVPVSALDSLDA